MTGTWNADASSIERLVVRLFVAEQVALQLDADVRGAEHADQPIDQAADAERAAVERGPPDQRHQAADVAVELLERERPLPLRARAASSA